MWSAEREAERREAALSVLQGKIRRWALAERTRRWRQHCVLKSFMQWQFWLVGASSRRRSLRKAVLRLANVSLHAAWDGWRQNAAESKIRSAVLGRAVSRLRHNAAFKAFNCWLSEARWRRESRKTVLRLLLRARLRFVSVCFCVWRERAERSAVGLRVHSLRSRLLDRMVSMHRSRTLTQHFVAWQALTRESMLRSERENSAVQRLQHAIYLRVFSAFSCWVWASKHRRAAADRVLIRVRRLLLTTVLRGWSEQAKWSRTTRVQVSHALLRHADQRLRLVTGAWRAWAARKAKRTRLLSKVLARCRRSHSAYAFEAWRHFARDSKRLGAAAARVGVRMRLRTLHVTFCAWFAELTQLQVERKQMQSSHFFGWLGAARERRAARTRAAGLYLQAWQRGMQEQKFEQEREQSLQALASLRLMLLHFQQTHTKLMLTHFQSRARLRLKTNSFDAWQVCAERRARSRRTVARGVKRMRNVIVIGAFHAWQDHADAANHLAHLRARRRMPLRY